MTTGTNQFVPFATGTGANVYSNSDYSGLTARSTGVVNGVADPRAANNAWRQGSAMAAAIGRFIALMGYDALDDADIDTLEDHFEAALAAKIAGGQAVLPSTSLIHVGVDTGSVNAIVADVTPDVSSWANGQVYVIRPANTNTSTAPTFKPDALAAKTIVHPNGTALRAGEIVGGAICTLIYDGSLDKVVLDDVVTNTAFTAAMSGFVSPDTIRGSSAGGATASFSFSALGLVSGVLAAADKSIAFNGASVGAGGMDAGAMPASGDLSIYAIYNPTTATWSSLGCTYATSHGETYSGSSMPSGYTVSRLISVHRTTSGAQLTPFVQVGRRVNIGRILINNGLNSGTWTSVGIVPTPALASSVRLEAQQTTTSSPSNIWFAPTSPGATSTLTHPGVVTSWSSNVQNDTTTVDVSIVAPGTLYHFVSQGQTWSAWLAGYTF